MEEKPHLMKNTALLGVTAFVSKAVSFILMPLYTSCLSPSEYGTADILISTAVLLLPWVSFNAPEAIFRFSAGGENPGAVLGAGLFSLLPGSFFFLLFLLFSAFSPIFSGVLPLLFCYLAGAGLHSFAATLVRARGDYTLFSVQQLFCTLLTVLLELLFLPIFALGVAGYLSAIFLADAVTAVILLLLLHRRGELRPTRFPRSLLLSMWRYAFPLIPTSALWWVISLSDRYVLLRYHGEAATGIYAAAGKIPALLTFVTGIFLEVWRYASLRVKREECAAFFGRIYGCFLPAVFAFTAFLITFGDPAVSFLFSSAYASASHLIPTLSLAALFSALASFLGSIYARQLTSFRSLLTALAGALLNLTLNFLLIPRFAGQGAALSTLAAWIAVYALRCADSRQILPFSRRFGKTAVAFLLCALSAACATAGEIPAALLFAGAALIPFWREAVSLCRIFVLFCQKMQKKLEKYQKST